MLTYALCVGLHTSENLAGATGNDRCGVRRNRDRRGLMLGLLRQAAQVNVLLPIHEACDSNECGSSRFVGHPPEDCRAANAGHGKLFVNIRRKEEIDFVSKSWAATAIPLRFES